jgi:hypothetical protein
MASADGSFSYASLSVEVIEIRLLRLDKSTSADEPVNCTLFKAPLDSKPDYVALSYEWGDSSVLETITVDGTSVTVRRNLALALKQISLAQGDMVLWVDAICINQTDVDERNHQVSLMRVIYKQASVVISWLGPSDATSHRAVALLVRLSIPWYETVEAQVRKGVQETNLRALGGLDDLWQELDSGMESLSALLSRSYWRRVWIFQEIVLAPSLVFFCGSDYFTYNQLMGAIGLVGAVAKTPGILPLESSIVLPYSPLWSVATMLAGSLYYEKPDKIMGISRKLHTTDPRDHVYGLLGIMNIQLEPDYSLTVAEVYCKFAWAWISQTSRLDALIFAGIATQQGSRTEGVPTWVPDWLGLSSGDTYITEHERFSASGSRSPRVRISPSLKSIWLWGVQCDVITTLPPVLPVAEQASLTNTFWSMILNPDGIQSHPAGISRLEAVFWLILRGEYGNLRQDPEALKPVVARFLILLVTVADFEAHMSKLAPQEDFDNKTQEIFAQQGAELQLMARLIRLWVRFSDAIANDYDKVMSYFEEMGPVAQKDPAIIKFSAEGYMEMQTRVAFHTSKGYVGLGPAGMAPGDVLCVLAGQNCPVVLRPRDSHYIMISNCIVTGLMDGEAWRDTSVGDTEGMEFEIR